MISFLFPLLFLLGITLTNSIIFNEKFEKVLPVAIMECLVITYITGFFSLLIGFWFGIFLSLSCIPLFFIMNKKHDYCFHKTYLTNMFWVFLILYFCIFVMNLGKSFSHWDDFSHWGVMAKELIRLDRYYYLKDSVLEYHKEYPPLSSILEYIWCKLCITYKERNLYNAKNIFCLSLFLPIISDLFKRCNKCSKSWNYVLCILFLPILIISLGITHTIGEASFYRSIYVETILASLFFYGSFCLSKEEENKTFQFINNLLLLTCLLLTKQIAIYFYAILILINVVHDYNLKRQNQFNRKQIIYTLLQIGIPLILWRIWNIIATANAPIGQFDSTKFSIQNLLSLIQGNGASYQYKTMSLFFTAIVKTPIINKPFPISYVGIVFIFIIALIVFLLIEKEEVIKNQIGIVCVCQILGAIGYIGVMLISYLYGFSVEESLSLACYKRYMSTMICPLLLIFIYYLIKVTLCKLEIPSSVIIATTITGLYLVFIPFNSIKDELLPGFYYGSSGEVFYGDCKILNENTPADSRIFLICQGDIGGGRNVIAYETNPRIISSSYFSLGEPYNTDDIYTKNITCEELTDKLKGYDYLYLSNVDEQFINLYSSIFNPNTVLKNQQLYKIIITDNSTLNLQPIAY